MAARYELTRTPDFVRLRLDQPDGEGDMLIPNDPANDDWLRYQQWLADGGVPDPYPYAIFINPALDDKPAPTTCEILGV